MTDGDIVRALLPNGATLAMARLGGRDQVAQAMAHGGWMAFEAPLPGIFFRTAARWPGVAVDVGANTGFYTMLALAAHRRNRVVAFEPVPGIATMLSKNLLLNAMDRRVWLRCLAAGARNGSGILYLPPDGHGLVETSASMRADFKPDAMREIRVRERRLDRAMGYACLGWPPLNVIKIDAEGYEAEVLSGAARLVRRHRPVIFIEVLPGADFTALQTFLHRNAYTDVALPPAGAPMPQEVVRFHPDSWNHGFVPRERLRDVLACWRGG